MAAFEKELKDYFKVAMLALLPGIVLAVILGSISSALGTASWLVYILYGVIMMWVVPNLPKEMDTFFEVLIVAFLLLGITGLIAMVVPQLSMWMSWITIRTVEAFIGMIVVASLSLAILNKFTDWL